MSIQLRLNLLIGFLLVLALGGMVTAMVLDAQPRTKAEAESIAQLTSKIITTSLRPLADSADPPRALANLVDDLKSLRHVSVTLATRQAQSQTRMVPNQDGFMFGIAIDQAAPPLKIPFEVSGRLLDTVIITPNPQDEISEVREAAMQIIKYGLLAGLALFALTSLVINRSLQPIETLRRAMHQLEDGDYGVRVAESGPPEIKRICSGLNTLASKLLWSRKENQQLTTNMIHVQDSERREIARELHDEHGACLFSLRTAGSVLERELERPAPDLTKARRLGREILSQLDSLQQTNRRVLQRLTPAGLQELGLKGAIVAIAGIWRREQPQTQLTLTIADGMEILDKTTELTVYRIIQEGLTNAYRHAGASQISVHASVVPKDAVAGVIPAVSALSTTQVLKVSVHDDGRGRSPENRDGFGLTSMRERVSALGGLMHVAEAHGGGTLIDVYLPATLS